MCPPKTSTVKIRSRGRPSTARANVESARVTRLGRDLNWLVKPTCWLFWAPVTFRTIEASQKPNWRMLTILTFFALPDFGKARKDRSGLSGVGTRIEKCALEIICSHGLVSHMSCARHVSVTALFSQPCIGRCSLTVEQISARSGAPRGSACLV